FQNGLMLGAMAALYADRGMGIDFWAWVLPHGVSELTAIVLCGAAGLSIAGAIIFPGRHGRLENLAHKGREISAVVMGAVGMLFVAALFEGFFRQLVQNVDARLMVATIMGSFWILYF